MKPRVQWGDGTPDEVKRAVLEQLRVNAELSMSGPREVVAYGDTDLGVWTFRAVQWSHECGAWWLTWVAADELLQNKSCPLCEPEQTKPADLVLARCVGIRARADSVRSARAGPRTIAAQVGAHRFGEGAAPRRSRRELVSNPRRRATDEQVADALVGTYDPSKVRVTIDGVNLDFSEVSFAQTITQRTRASIDGELFIERQIPIEPVKFWTPANSGIRAAVLAVPGVTECVVEQDTRSREYAVRLIVTGGENVAIAEALVSVLPAGVMTLGAVEVEGHHEQGMRYAVRFDRPKTNGFACERCKGAGRMPMSFTYFGAGLPSDISCPDCSGLGCVELAEWAARNRYRIDRRGDTVAVVGRRESVVDFAQLVVAFARGESDRGGRQPTDELDGANPLVIEGSLGVVLFWALAHELGGVLSFAHDLDRPWEGSDAASASNVVESITECSRPLCTLPDQWEIQIDARFTEVVIDEVVGGRAVRRMGKLTEVARRRAEATIRRSNEELESVWNAEADGRHFSADEYDRISEEVKERKQRDLAVIRDSIAGIDPYEPEWHATWWLALREWTSAGKEPDADAMADILRGLVSDVDSYRHCICNRNPETTDGPEQDCPVHGWSDGPMSGLIGRVAPPAISVTNSRVVTSLGYNATWMSTSLRSSVEPFALADRDSLDVRVDTTTRTVIFRAYDFADITRATAREVALACYSQLTGVRVVIEGDRLVLASERENGEAIRVEAVGGTALEALGFQAHDAYAQRDIQLNHLVIG